jgi:IS605 OrfB family transposase
MVPGSIKVQCPPEFSASRPIFSDNCPASRNPAALATQILTYKYRIKDATTARHLSRHAVACNAVWNFCVSTQREAQRRRDSGLNTYWPSAFDLIKLCAGAPRLLNLRSDTIDKVCQRFVFSRDQKKRCPRFRRSFNKSRSLGWIPFKGRSIKVDQDAVTLQSRTYRFWKTREISGVIKSGAFVEDARGRWYVAFECEVADALPTGSGEVGIDLGLKTLATLSDGSTVPALRHYRKYQAALAVQQRAGNKRRVRAIHAKITNARKHQIHEATTRITRENALVVVGNVNAAKLAKTRMAKSVFDAGWSMFRNQLRYKASRHGAKFVEADERWTTVTCSSCGARSGPQGQKGLRIRHWECEACGISHLRDVNSALNILNAGAERCPPAVGIAA